MKKRMISLAIALVLVFGMLPVGTQAAESETEISLWTYPIGGWSNQATVESLIAAFEEANPGIKVSVEYLTYSDGDVKVDTAIEGGAAPDLILEGPERLVANWAERGLMVDLSDLLDETDVSELNPAALAACQAGKGKLYEYPLAMTTHCMAINRNVFEAAGAMQYLNAETHTWNSTEDFFKAVDAVYTYTGKQVGAVFCGGQGGDQGTRALVTNLYGGTFTDAAHTRYTWDSPENIAALQALYDCEGIAFDPSIVGGDEIALFYRGELNMAFCWNIAQQLNPNSAGTGAGLTANGDEILFMAFPSNNAPQLCGAVWGFGIFDNHDDARIAAAKTFIKYMCDSDATADAVKATNYFPVRDAAEGTDLSGIWADNPVMTEHKVLMPMLGDYYQVTPCWEEARAQWWNMLAEIAFGEDIRETVIRYTEELNQSLPEPSEPEETEPTVPSEPEETEPTVPSEPEETDPTVPTEPEPVVNPFKDVKKTDYFYDPVMWAVSNDITSGMSATEFGPKRPCTRGHIVTFLWRAAGEPEPTTTVNPFRDVPESAFYYKAVLWAVENGITTGMKDGEFWPNHTCTRAQAVTFLYRAAGEPEISSKANPFRDVKSGAFYYDAVLWAVENNITNGMSAGEFSPNLNCTRGQIVTFLYRSFSK